VTRLCPYGVGMTMCILGWRRLGISSPSKLGVERREEKPERT